MSQLETLISLFTRFLEFNMVQHVKIVKDNHNLTSINHKLKFIHMFNWWTIANQNSLYSCKTLTLRARL